MRRIYIRSTAQRHGRNDLVTTGFEDFLLTGKTHLDPLDGAEYWEAEEANQGQFKHHTGRFVYIRFVYNHNIGEQKMSVENATEPQYYRRGASAVAEALAKAYVTRAAELNKLAERMRFWKPGEEVDVELARLLEREERELRIFL